MKICVIERFLITPFPLDLFTEHIKTLWRLYLHDILREAHKFSDRQGAIYVFEAKNLDEAKGFIGRLPLAANSFCSYEFLSLGPYRTWEAIFDSDDKDLLAELSKPFEKPSSGAEQFWVMASFNENFTHNKYQELVRDQAICTFKYVKAGIFQQLYVMQRPLIVTINMVAKDIDEANEYLDEMPFRSIADWVLIPISPFDFWQILMSQENVDY